jgi:hypothetical protein
MQPTAQGIKFSTYTFLASFNDKLISYQIQDVSKRALQLWKLIEIYTEDIHNVLNCQNVAKHTEFYLEYLFATVSTYFFDSFFTVPPPSPLRQGPMGNTAAITITMHMTK